jgi:hypothetical protein
LVERYGESSLAEPFRRGKHGGANRNAAMKIRPNWPGGTLSMAL